MGDETRGLRSRAPFKRDETRRDWKAIPELAGPGQDYFFMVPLLGKIREKFKKNSGWDGTTQNHSGKVLNGLEMTQMLGTGNYPGFFGKNLVPGKWHSGTQTSR